MRNWRWGAHTEEIQQGADWLSSKLLKDTTWWAYFGKQKEVKPGERVTRRQFPIGHWQKEIEENKNKWKDNIFIDWKD